MPRYSVQLNITLDIEAQDMSDATACAIEDIYSSSGSRMIALSVHTKEIHTITGTSNATLQPDQSTSPSDASSEVTAPHEEVDTDIL